MSIEPMGPVVNHLQAGVGRRSAIGGVLLLAAGLAQGCGRSLYGWPEVRVPRTRSPTPEPPGRTAVLRGYPSRPGVGVITWCQLTLSRDAEPSEQFLERVTDEYASLLLAIAGTEQSIPAARRVSAARSDDSASDTAFTMIAEYEANRVIVMRCVDRGEASAAVLSGEGGTVPVALSDAPRTPASADERRTAAAIDAAGVAINMGREAYRRSRAASHRSRVVRWDAARDRIVDA
jgi:hypothetical protein